MNKIPTVFVRDPENRKHVTPEVTPGCEWVLAGEGVATRKYDGTCVMFDGEHWWARREVKPGKAAPDGFVDLSTDATTGKTMGWEPADQTGFWKYHQEAIGHGDWEPGTYELCGPKINGNPESYDTHVLIPHAHPQIVAMTTMPPTYESLVSVVGYVLRQSGWEGIVWHHPDGRMAKLKVRDFPSD